MIQIFNADSKDFIIKFKDFGESQKKEIAEYVLELLRDPDTSYIKIKKWHDVNK